MARYKEFEDWFKHTQDIPGAFYLWVVRNLFRDNALIAGKLEVRGSTVKLGSLTMPLNLLAGASDHITPPDQVFALADHAGDARPTQVQRRISSGGHLGLFMGHEALAEHWPPLLAQVARPFEDLDVPALESGEAVGSHHKRARRRPSRGGERQISYRKVRDDRDVLRPPSEARIVGSVPAVMGSG